ncbi:ATP/GTP-binding protein [Micromonospora sp. HUAS LYJ1]|uniref:GTP-binding protein n=1 Tax=Micromonospora sp. HUAS LYJ1 TaxID=3061626 RepID=UPI002673567E|nr:ATP/GTP-binding protein [Micromonospora sp. HUAS LYJ1]WKU03568.1 ATP/GTP-binding protein [Micromonospora sp. HUAS LYJ1]
MDRKSVKVVVAGGFGTGKTTLVGSVSEIPPLVTEEVLTQASIGVDDITGVEDKSSTTVALDFGRITISNDVVLYLFGTPGQDRFWFIWDELAQGAVGAIVLVDTRRLGTSFPAVDYFERRGIPFVAAVNRFFGECPYTEEEIRAALELDETVPLLWCDARDRASSKQALIELVRHALSRLPATA